MFIHKTWSIEFIGSSIVSGDLIKDAQPFIDMVTLKRERCLSDRETVNHIQEIHYSQYTVGLKMRLWWILLRHSFKQPVQYLSYNRNHIGSHWSVELGCRRGIRRWYEKVRSIAHAMDVYPEAVASDVTYSKTDKRHYWNGCRHSFTGKTCADRRVLLKRIGRREMDCLTAYQL